VPDWITHLGTAYVAARATRISAVRPLLLGALLPDVTHFSILLIDYLGWPAIPTFAYLAPFHSLLVVSLLAGAIALLSERSWPVFGLIEAGAASHFVLDDLEGAIGCGSTTFYPLYFGKPLNLWPADGAFAGLLLLVGALGCGAALVSRARHARAEPGAAWSLCVGRRRYLGAALMVAGALGLPWLTRQALVERNAYYLAFFADPPAWQGVTVELCFSEIVAADPPVVEEFDARLPIAAGPQGWPGDERPLAVGDWVSLRGIYRDGALHPTLLVHHQKSSDLLLSVLAGAIFVVLWLPPRRWDASV
jgi:hypothetical protein